MDVFIPEEYVARRRTEKKAAAMARKGSNTVSESGKRSMEKSDPPPFRRLDNNEFLVSGGLSENVVFSCFSA